VQLLRAVFNSAVRNRLITHNPAKGLSLPRMDSGRIVPLMVSQVQAWADAVPERNRAMILVQGGLGCRIGELLGLQVADVSEPFKTVRFENQLTQDGKQLVEPKTANSRRTVPAPAMVLRLLSEHLAEFPPVGGFVFTDKNGKPWRQEYLDKYVYRPAVAAAGLPDGTTSHDLRHHAVSVLLDAGLSVTAVAEFVGDTVATIVKAYAHLMPGREDAMRQAIDSAWTDGQRTDRLRAL
jgi:integrase